MRLGLLAALILACRPAAGATFLFLNSDGEYIGAGRQQLFTPVDGVFTAENSGAGGEVITIRFDGGASHSWWLDFSAPAGAILGPGSYEMAERWPFQSPTRPGLSVSGEGRGCNQSSGRFVVRDVVYGVTPFTVESFAADFEQHCEHVPNALTGSIRYRTGDHGCAAASDGTPCDDLDACTAASTCQAGVCTGTQPTSCPFQDGCTQSGLCDPVGGTCVVTHRPDGMGCGGPDQCGGFAMCLAGECVIDTGACSDGNVCTEDFCDGLIGCTSRPLPCWAIRGRTTATAVAADRVVRRSRRFTSALLLRDDGTYVAPGGLVACPGTTVRVPDEVGHTRPGPRGRLLLEPDNLSELVLAASDCTGRPLVLKRYKSWVKVLPSGFQLTGAARLAARVRIGGQSVTIVATSRFVGTQQMGGSVSAATGIAEAAADVVSAIAP